MIAAIDPSALVGAANPAAGSEWQVQGIPDIPGNDAAIPSVDGAAPAGSDSFGSMLGNEIEKLQASQDAAAQAGTALANGTATDPVQAVTAVEQAQLSMDFASQLRSRGSEALQSIFQTQV
ncbi:MAG TPA: flagellar hook-basal body complex protein FliE [Conexibacter sp.]|jgi:flagellar hook-basal body complex protein FliE